jgi:hypothetical protein
VHTVDVTTESLISLELFNGDHRGQFTPTVAFARVSALSQNILEIPAAAG